MEEINLPEQTINSESDTKTKDMPDSESLTEKMEGIKMEGIKKQLNEQMESFSNDRNITEHIISMKKLAAVIQSQTEDQFTDAFALLVEHFISRIHDYACCEGGDDALDRSLKVEISEEIDQSIAAFWNMIEQGSQSIWNADRIISPVNPGLKPISFITPKLYRYYSAMLNDLAILFSDSGIKYAFCVNPIPSGKWLTKILFEQRYEHGKVVLISVPETEIADVQTIRFVLLHEFFHVLPREKRLREFRDGIAEEVILEILSGFLSSDRIDGSAFMQDANTVVRELLKCFLKPYTEDDEKSYYSKECQIRIASEWRNILIELDQPEECDVYWAQIIGDHKQNVEHFDTVVSCMGNEGFTQCSENIRYNVEMILAEEMLKQLVETLFIVFREGFADLYAILSLNISPEQYADILNGQCSVPVTEDVEDGLWIKLRYFFVCLTMKKIKDDAHKLKYAFLESWRKEIDTTYNELTIGAAEIERLSEDKAFAVENIEKIWTHMISNKEALRLIESYFLQCAHGWLEKVSSESTVFESFYKKFYLISPLAGSASETTKKNSLEVLSFIANA